MSNLNFKVDQHEFERGDLPCSVPDEGAIAAGVFGFDENGAIAPSVDDVRAMTLEHARDLAGILLAISHLQDCIAGGIEPESGKATQKRGQRVATVQRLTAEIARLNRHYDDVLAAFADGFGWEGADALDRFVRSNCHEVLTRRSVSVQRELF